MKKVAGRLRLDLAQYRELEAFAAFASDLDRASRSQLERGARLVELLKQPNYSPYPVEEQVVSVWAGTEGKLDDIPVGDDRAGSRREFLQYLRHSHAGRARHDRRQRLERRHRDQPRTRRSPTSSRCSSPRTASRSSTRTAAEAMAEGVETKETVKRVKKTAAAGEEVSHGRLRTRPSSADPDDPVDEEDHQGDGARRDEPHRQGPGAGRGVAAVRGGDHRWCSPRWRATRTSTTRCCRPRPRVRRAGRPGDHQRPRSVRRLQRQRDPHRRAARSRGCATRASRSCCTWSAARA